MKTITCKIIEQEGRKKWLLFTLRDVRLREIIQCIWWIIIINQWDRWLPMKMLWQFGNRHSAFGIRCVRVLLLLLCSLDHHTLISSSTIKGDLFSLGFPYFLFISFKARGLKKRTLKSPIVQNLAYHLSPLINQSVTKNDKDSFGYFFKDSI